MNNSQDSALRKKSATTKKTKQTDEAAEVAALKQELQAEKDAKLMAWADLQNYRKRVEQEKELIRTMGNISILKSIADLIDDLTRLINDLEEPGVEDKIDAFKSILSKAQGILVDHSVTEIQIEKGAKFDPEIMEAIGTTTVEEADQENTIIEITQKGYWLAEKNVIRHARVIVGKLAAKK